MNKKIISNSILTGLFSGILIIIVTVILWKIDGTFVYLIDVIYNGSSISSLFTGIPEHLIVSILGSVLFSLIVYGIKFFNPTTKFKTILDASALSVIFYFLLFIPFYYLNLVEKMEISKSTSILILISGLLISVVYGFSVTLFTLYLNKKI
ncbi:hypothetical protein [Caldiplasma sukawensis]